MMVVEDGSQGDGHGHPVSVGSIINIIIQLLLHSLTAIDDHHFIPGIILLLLVVKVKHSPALIGATVRYKLLL